MCYIHTREHYLALKKIKKKQTKKQKTKKKNPKRNQNITTMKLSHHKIYRNMFGLEYSS
jgi:F0F1-type ATP synthase assembly protein I